MVKLFAHCSPFCFGLLGTLTGAFFGQLETGIGFCIGLGVCVDTFFGPSVFIGFPMLDMVLLICKRKFTILNFYAWFGADNAPNPSEPSTAPALMDHALPV